MMLWSTRANSLRLLKERFASTDQLVKQSFRLYDALIEKWSPLLERGPFERLAGILTVKARYLSHAELSLMLDGYGQEAGALLRLQVECLQLLRYLRSDPAHVDSIVRHGNLPRAGEVAKANQGLLRELRDYLNIHASHVSLSYDSLHHGLDMNRLKLRAQPPLAPATLNRNLKSLLGLNQLTLRESGECLLVADPDSLDYLADALDDHMTAVRKVVARLRTGADGAA